MRLCAKGEVTMTNKKAISILECMAIDITGALMDAGMTSSKRTVLMQKLDAINLAQKALRDTSIQGGTL